MTGRGTDIVLGGGFNEDERQKIVNLGGLHVIGTERHESRRIDNQLRGRSEGKEIPVHLGSFIIGDQVNICS